MIKFFFYDLYTIHLKLGQKLSFNIFLRNNTFTCHDLQGRILKLEGKNV